jgi:hypothetical protein
MLFICGKYEILPRSTPYSIVPDASGASFSMPLISELFPDPFMPTIQQ